MKYTHLISLLLFFAILVLALFLSGRQINSKIEKTIRENYEKDITVAFLSQKFGKFKGGGKFVVTIIALIYAYGNLQIYNIIGLYAPYTNRVIFNKIRNISLWHTLCILMTIYDLTQKHKKKFKLKNNFI